MKLTERINAFSQLSFIIDENNDQLQSTVGKACYLNPWFTKESVWLALKAMKSHFLNKEALIDWLNPYAINEPNELKSVGLILAGNIPLVGFHDVLSVLISGHKVILKLSEKDSVLIPYLLDELIKIEPQFKPLIQTQERLKNYEAVIATGSDSAGALFEKYFKDVPNLIRKNRHGIAIIHKDVAKDELTKLGQDIFQYFGLGCRNVSKIYIEEGFNIDMLFESLYDFYEIIHHNKYKNNYDYSNALYLMNSEQFLTNDFLILRPHKQISSRISTLHFEYFVDENVLSKHLSEKALLIQCIVSSKPIPNQKVFAFGKAQNPGLNDYADGVDTLEFLKSI